MNPIKTRFAPSPTGFLHIGGARTALFSWAYARRYGGQFVLRIEDTDIERSIPEAVQGILDGMHWLSLTHDEGPYFQTQRMARYQAVIAQMLKDGTAYHCYTPKEELDALRAAQEAQKIKPRYDGRWRPETGKTLPPIPADVSPVVRFKNPTGGAVAWDDAVKGRIEIANAELDDLIIARADSTPTYNFCVVVDDWDMGITHVIRGDDHVNNTPRQINILRALGASLPTYAHLSMILGDDGSKLSKRHGAVSVMQYAEEGFLPEAVINYLARLGWSHGDEEIFSRDQFCAWFDLDRLTPSPAQFNTDKLKWLNQQYLRALSPDDLAKKLEPYLAKQGLSDCHQPPLGDAAPLYLDRCHTLSELAESLAVFYRPLIVDSLLLQAHLNATALPALSDFIKELADISWEKEAVSAALKNCLKKHGLKMPALAMPLRILLTGKTETPSVDALITLLGRDRVLKSLAAYG